MSKSLDARDEENTSFELRDPAVENIKPGFDRGESARAVAEDGSDRFTPSGEKGDIPQAPLAERLNRKEKGE